MATHSGFGGPPQTVGSIDRLLVPLIESSWNQIIEELEAIFKLKELGLHVDQI